jgi:mono/diheme cytochrome c family protein
MGVILRVLATSLVALSIFATASIVRAQNAGPLPPGDGQNLVAVACSQCHYLGTIAKIRDGAAGWRLYVNNMVLRGAQLTPPEIDTVVNYLSLNFGPGANLPPPHPVTLPDDQGGNQANNQAKSLVETRCALCHDLERVAAFKRSKQSWPTIVANMVARGATATPDEAKAISDYLAANFGN